MESNKGGPGHANCPEKILIVLDPSAAEMSDKLHLDKDRTTEVFANKIRTEQETRVCTCIVAVRWADVGSRIHDGPQSYHGHFERYTQTQWT